MGNDGMTDEDPNAGDYEGDDDWTPEDGDEIPEDGDEMPADDDEMPEGDDEPNNGEFDNDFNDEQFYGDYDGKDYGGAEWTNLVLVFAVGWFLCGSSLLGWSCYYHRNRSSSKVQWEKDLVDEGFGNEEQQMIAVN